MDNRKTTAQTVIMTACLAVLFFFALTIIVRVGTRMIFIEKLGIRNAFTDFVFSDSQTLSLTEDEEAKELRIAWDEQYPFEKLEGESEQAKAPVGAISRKLAGFSDSIKRIEEKIDIYTQSKLMGYQKLVRASKLYDDFINWNYISLNEYNGVIELPDGYLTTYSLKLDETTIAERADAVVDLQRYCDSLGIDLLYVQVPNKISKYSDTDISGSLDFSNQDSDALLDELKADGVETFDLREAINNEGFNHHELFFRTDHHWLPSTGLWAAQRVLEFCNDKFNLGADAELLDASLFDEVVYPEWFLGSQGKKITLARTTPEDISLLYPSYEVEFHYELPSLDIDMIGDFSVSYDMNALKYKDFTNSNPYQAYNYGDKALVSIENLSSKSDKSIMLFLDSFGNCVSSFIALGVREVDAVDLRYFTGSVQSLIASKNPDLVVVLYNPGAIADADGAAEHNKLYNFE